MFHLFASQRYFKKVSQNKNIKNFLFFYFFGIRKQLVSKLTCIELINVLHFN